MTINVHLSTHKNVLTINVYPSTHKNVFIVKKVNVNIKSRVKDSSLKKPTPGGRYIQSQKTRKPNNIKAFGSKKIKEPKQDSITTTKYGQLRAGHKVVAKLNHYQIWST